MCLKQYKLEDLYKMSSGLSSNPNQAGYGFPFISFTTIFKNVILPDIIIDRMQTNDIEQKKYSIKKGDVLITRTSENIDELAMTSVAVKDYPNTTFSGFAKRLRPTIKNIEQKITYDKYMAFFFRSNYFRKIINNMAIMTLRASFNEQILSYIKILLPSYKHQVKVGNLLYSIYKQIERNNAMVKRLQVLAHITFDYFSKNNNKCNFVVLNDILIEKDKSKIQVSDVQDASGFIPFFTSGDAVLYTNEKLETGFNIFLSTGGNAKVQAYYGDVSYSTDTWCITAKNNLQFHLFEYLKHIESQMDKLYFHGTGLKHLQKPIFLKSIISIPNEDLLKKYNTIVEPIYQQISKIEQSTIQLQCSKNKLLPLLINQQLT